MEFESLVWTLKRLCFLGFLNLNLFRVLAFCFTFEWSSTNRFAVRFASCSMSGGRSSTCFAGRFASVFQYYRTTVQLVCLRQTRWASQQLKGGSFGFLRCFKWVYRTLPVVFRFFICLPIISDLQGHRGQKDSGKKL